MNNSLNRLIDGMIAQLRGEIIPRLDDEFARGQAFGVVDVLNNLKPRIDWLATPLRDEVNEQHDLLIALKQQFGSVAGYPAYEVDVELDAVAGDIERLRNRLDDDICDVIDWLGVQRGALAANEVAVAEARIKEHMQRQLKRELSLTPKPLFAEISKG